jgi:aromatic ring-opening dioxygenase catalytic subunit (LigB family)
MAQIVGGVGVPHTPHFPGIVARGEPPAREISRLYGEVAATLRDLAPDVLIFLTCDHYTNFFVESVPIFSIGVADAARGPSDYLELPRCEAVIDSPLARRIQAHAVSSGFDVGMSQEFDLDHPVTVPLHFLTPAMDVPVVPVFINGLIPPLPPAWRCRALGEVIAEAVGQVAEPLRVAAVASGSFSLEIGGPRLSATSHTGVPDPDWTDRVLELLAVADLDRLTAEASAKQLTQAGNAAGELLTWITMLGMFAPCPPAFLEAQREFGHAYGAWQA